MLEFLEGGLGEPSLPKEGSPDLAALNANSYHTIQVGRENHTRVSA